MAVLKCKMCGGDLAFSEGATTCVCEFCGSTNALPALYNIEQRANLYNRANRLRMQCEFDKAAAAYEKILDQDNTDAEAHWGAVLSRWGIEYVTDPTGGGRVPTCHRVETESILADPDYLAALEHAPYLSVKEAYEVEAGRIARIQKDILAISQKEKPYDVFLCYKETGADGQRTKDSTLAQDIYYQLTQEGCKVFFSRITLEDKLGREYEPYIFAALHSARVMLVIGTKPEHFDAVWVRNEWSRYLRLMHGDRNRLLIPCYRDMDPYDLPEELSNLQSQDMGKIGFMQDLLRGVKKVLEAKQVRPAASRTAPASEAAAPGVASLLKRAGLFLEDGDFHSASQYADKVLDIDPECAQAYMVKVLAARNCHSAQELEDRRADGNLPDDPDMKKAIRFSRDAGAYQRIALRAQQTDAFIQSMNRIFITLDPEQGVEENAACAEKLLQERVGTEGMRSADENAYREAAARLDALTDYPHAEACAKLCWEMAEIIQYNALVSEVERVKSTDHWKRCKELADGFDMLGDYRNARQKSEEMAQMAKNIVRRLYDQGVRLIGSADVANRFHADSIIRDIRKLAEEVDITEAEKLYVRKTAQFDAEDRAREKSEAMQAARKKRKKAIAITLLILASAGICAYFFVLKPMMEYNAAKGLYAAGKYEEAISAFEAMEGFGDSDAQIAACQTAIQEEEYQAAKDLLVAERYEEAISAFKALNGYSDSDAQIAACYTAIKEREYQAAKDLLAAERYEEAYVALTAMSGYRDVDTLLTTDDNLLAVARETMLATLRAVGGTVAFGRYEQDNDMNNGAEAIEWIVLANEGERSLLIAKRGLDARTYHHEMPYPTWAKSDIRAWLNGEFLSAAFTQEEQVAIVKTTITTPSYGGNSGGADTRDRIFLLSCKEAEAFFTGDEARKCALTAYAVAMGAYQSNKYKLLDGAGCCWWWLRSPDSDSDCASVVAEYGFILGYYVDNVVLAARPAFWLDLSAL